MHRLIAWENVPESFPETCRIIIVPEAGEKVGETRPQKEWTRRVFANKTVRGVEVHHR